MNEQQYDKQLGIKTAGMLEISGQSVHYNRYEATPYEALTMLGDKYALKQIDSVVDYGCGKGRVSFYLHNRFHCSVTGIEMNRQLYRSAIDNHLHYRKKKREKGGFIAFEHCFAENYEISSEDNLFYFFNPFSVEIFMNVVRKIVSSVEQHPRDADLILYFPTIDYVEYLERQTVFTLYKEIKVDRLYEKNDNERFLIYRLIGK